MKSRELRKQLEQLERVHGEDCEVKLYLSIEGQLLDDFSISHYEDKEIHINSSQPKEKE